MPRATSIEITTNDPLLTHTDNPSALISWELGEELTHQEYESVLARIEALKDCSPHSAEGKERARLIELINQHDFRYTPHI
ncbi:hypothetical protein [Vibrio sp.]|uniref:hypothetical protein n=1 Tax=Vibrio sp. TaxID=678 RepID=UPI003D0C8C41